MSLESHCSMCIVGTCLSEAQKFALISKYPHPGMCVPGTLVFPSCSLILLLNVETEPLICGGAGTLIYAHFSNFQEAGSMPRMQSGIS